MVFFSCEGCNETLKKAQVENHLRRALCSRYPVSCVDCSQVFQGSSYQAHTSCISEAEKYEKSLYKGPKSGNKGGKGKKRNPQEEWMEMIASVACDNSETGGVSSILRRHLSRMAELGNVPRNEKKFKNFLNNSLRINRSNEQDELWKYLKGKMDENKPAAEAPSGQVMADKAEEGKKEGTTRTMRAASEPQDDGQVSSPLTDKIEKGLGKGEKKRKKKKDEKKETSRAEQEPATPQHEHKKRKKDKAEAAASVPNGARQKEKNECPNMSTSAVGCTFAWGKVIKKVVKKAPGRRIDRHLLRGQVLTIAAEQVVGDKKEMKKVFKEMLGGGIPGLQVNGNEVMYIKQQ